ncbi:hypothetical protein ACFL67_00230 [candidate division KSB1 bacterium]
MKIYFTNIFLFLVCFFTPLSSYAQEHEPGLQWKTAVTEHFLIHFPESFENTAREVASISESIYPPVCESLNFYPERTHIVIHTRTDISNGFVAPLPYRMELFLSDPQGDNFGSGAPWLRTLITHEFTHIVQFMKHNGLSSITKPFFGELNSFWHQYSIPGWFIEGFAVQNETHMTNGGRGRSAYQLMKMAGTQAGMEPWNFNNINYFSRKRLPVGMRYIAGYYLSKYISREYGDDAWSRIMDAYLGNPVFGFNRAVKQVTGRDEEAFYTEVIDDFRKIKYSTSESKVLFGADMGELPVNDYSPRWIDEDKLMAWHFDYDTKPYLTILSADGKSKRIIERNLSSETNGFDVSRNYIVWSELQRHVRFSATVYSDLVLYDRNTGNRRRVTTDQRVSNPDIAPDEMIITAVQNRTDRTALVTVSPEDGQVNTLFSQEDVFVLNPRWSPDGDNIAFIVKDQEGVHNIAVINAETGEHELLTDDRFHQNEPCWSPDGKFILYTSDRSGIFNIYAIEIHSGLIRQVTDEPLGAFTPDISPDGSRIAFGSYMPTGIRAAAIPFDPGKWQPVQKNDENNPLIFSGSEKTTSITPAENVETRPYSALSQILIPQGYMPFINDDTNGTSVGLFGLSGDALHRHFWSGMATVNKDGAQPGVDIEYSYARWWPKLFLRGYSLPDKIQFMGRTGWWRKSGLHAITALPLVLESNTYTTVIQPSLGFRSESYRRSEGPFFPLYDDYRGIAAGLRFYRSTQAVRDIAPRLAVNFAAYGDWSNKYLDSDFISRQISAVAGVYFPTLIEHHQIQLLAAYQQRRGLYDYGFFGALPVGYNDDYFGNHFRFKTAYHFPISYIEWKVPFVPLFLEYLSGALFYDWGSSWEKDSPKWDDRERYSAGFQLGVSNIAFQSLFSNAGIRLFYRSLDKKWTAEPYISVDLPLPGSNTGMKIRE